MDVFWYVKLCLQKSKAQLARVLDFKIWRQEGKYPAKLPVTSDTPNYVINHAITLNCKTI